MDVFALIDDLRSRINPAYANTLGTESYERRLCVEAMEAQTKEIERLRALIQEAHTTMVYARMFITVDKPYTDLLERLEHAGCGHSVTEEMK